MPVAEEFVLVGRVAKAHSVRGEIKIYPYSEEPEHFLRYGCVLLTADQNDQSPVEYRIERARIQKKAVLVQLAGCATRNDAEQLVRAEVYVYEEDLPKPEPDEFYLRDLEGREMKTEAGELIGRVTGLMSNGGQDLARVQNHGQEYLIPLIPEFLLAIDEDEVVVSLPPGLLDINT